MVPTNTQTLIIRKSVFKANPSQARFVKTATKPIIMPIGAVIRVGYAQTNKTAISLVNNEITPKITKQIPMSMAITNDIMPKTDLVFWAGALSISLCRVL